MAEKLHHSDSDLSGEKFAHQHLEEIAMNGHVATDAHGNALIEIDEAAEARLRWKIDLHLIPTIALLYLFCFIDRANIGNARLSGLEKDLKLKGYDYNILLSAFYVAYAVFEIPANMLCKKVGPSRFLPASTIGFGLFAMCTGFIHTKGQGIAVRFLLGICEGGVFPGMAYYLSRWYRRDELAFRFSLYVVCAPLAGAFGGLLASGILKLHSVGMFKSWRMIFIVEGIITMGLGLIAFFTLTESPETAKWLSEDEKLLCATRIKSDNIGSTVVLDRLNTKGIRNGIFNINTFVIALIFMFDNITVQGMGFFLPTVIKTIYPKKTTIQLQLQTVPPYIVGAFFTLLIPFLSWKTKRRALYMSISAPFIIAGYIVFVVSHNPHARYAAAFLVAIGAFSFGALCTAWATVSCSSDSMRNGAIGLVVGFGNLGGLISTWTFLPRDAPNYKRGNSTNLGTSVAILVLTVGLWGWQIQQNRKKEAADHDGLLDGKSPEEIENMGVNHPGFRYQH